MHCSLIERFLLCIPIFNRIERCFTLNENKLHIYHIPRLKRLLNVYVHALPDESKSYFPEACG